MRLTEPGLYVARDGRVAISYGTQQMHLFVRHPDGRPSYHAPNSESTEGEWQKIGLPKFPELPKKPLLVYANRSNGNEWMAIRRDGGYTSVERSVGGVDYSYLVVCSHPDNDPEAVALIEAARKEDGNDG